MSFPWCCAVASLWLLFQSSASPPVPIALPNAGFEASSSGSWELIGGSPGVAAQESSLAYEGRASLRISRTDGPTAITLAASHLPAVRPGETYKLAAFVKTKDATGETYISLDGCARGAAAISLAKSRCLSGTTPGWLYVWAVADVPRESGITNLRPTLHSDNNAGTAWFDDVVLYRLPADKPVVTGPPSEPPFGQLVVRNGHLVGKDGQRVRLWGVNCVDEPGRTYREITYVAERIKRMGFNAVRLHIYDSRFIDVDAVNQAGEPTSLVLRKSRRGDGSVLDRLDYFIYCCERQGLYLYMTFDRLTAGFGPGDYHVLPPGDAEDERAWKEALKQLQSPGGCDEHVYFVDPRLGEAQARFVRQVLSHRNSYTGRRVADDPYVALYELTNENHFPEWALQGGFRQWPAYFQHVMQRRWNEWLTKRYGTEATLVAAWGGLADGESLAENTIKLAPVLGEADEYPRERLADFHRFIYELFTSYSRRLETIVRQAGSCSARAPVSWDTIHEHKHKWYYPCSQADLMTVGVYFSGPWLPDPSARRLRPDFQGLYNLSWASVLNKPTVVYETNTIKPDCWRADYPILMCAFASTHDWDGVFWYCWADGTVPDEFDADTYWATGLRYAAPTHIWHGIVTSTDEVLLASVRLGGTIFTKACLPPTPRPVVVTVGAEDLLGRTLWIGDVDVPYPEDAPEPYKRASALAITDFLYTVRYKYDLSVQKSSLTRPLLARLPDPCRPVSGLTYHLARGLTMIDRPAAKAAVGFVSGSQIVFSDGVRLRLSALPDPPFLCFGIAAEDGQALALSRKATVVLTTYGENLGLELWHPEEAPAYDMPLNFRIVKSWGYGPAQIHRPGAEVSLGGKWHWRLWDFRLRGLGEGFGEVLRIEPGTPVFFADLWR